MKSLLKIQHWPLRLKIVLLLFISSVLPLAIMGGDAFHDLYRSGSERFAEMPSVQWSGVETGWRSSCG